MKTILKYSVLVSAAALMSLSSVLAQDRFTVNAKADFVSNYVWRGSDQNSGFSVQPYLTMTYKGLNLTVNGSQSLTHSENAPQEFDINLGYSIKGFTFMISDYWWQGMQAPYGHYLTGHHFEGTLAYSFKDLCNLPLNLSWSTWFAGYDDYKSDKDGNAGRAFSTYISASYDIDLPADVTLTPAIGFTPWQGVYYKKACITDITLKASKGIEITDNFSIPLFVQVIAAPYDSAKGVDKAYLVAGFSLGF